MSNSKNSKEETSIYIWILGFIIGVIIIYFLFSHRVLYIVWYIVFIELFFIETFSLLLNFNKKRDAIAKQTTFFKKFSIVRDDVGYFIALGFSILMSQMKYLFDVPKLNFFVVCLLLVFVIGIATMISIIIVLVRNYWHSFTHK